MSIQDHSQYPPPGYGQQTSNLAVISLVSGIVSFFILPFIAAIIAIITGNQAKKEIRLSGGRLTGESMANWGVILGWVNIGLIVLSFCAAFFIILATLGVFGAVSLPLCFMPFVNNFY